MMEVINLTHRFGDKLILDRVNLKLNEGSIMGLVGINGAGKSTLLRLMSGVYLPEEGDVLCDGLTVQNEKARKNLFFLPDDPYYTGSTTGMNLCEMYRVFYPDIKTEEYQAYLKEFGLDPQKPLRNFSKGMRRQTYVALALSVHPKYLLLDEAFDGLDPLARLRFKKTINQAVEDTGMGVIISSHSLRELEDFCDSYALIDSHTVAESGSIAEHVGLYCKFQLAFTQPVSKEDFAHLPLVSFTGKSRFATLVLKGESLEMQKQLSAMEPLIMEEMPMDFEELFICEVGEEGRIL